MINCPKCNTENPTGARFCESCGNVLSKTKPKGKQTEDLNFCPDCGKPIELNASFCAHCGASFGEQCPQCQAINQADAKFCLTCAEPLNWICPVCNSKNQAGAMFCASCGSDTIIKKPIYKDLRYWSVAAMIIILLGTTFTKLNQFDNDLQNAIQNADNNKFDMAYQSIEEAENNWLPFTNTKAQKTKSYIIDKEDNYKAKQAEQRRASNRRNTQASSNTSNSSNSNTSSGSGIDINGTNLFTIIVENDGFFNIEIPRYTVKIQRTDDLNGKPLYDYPREETHTSGFFGSDATFYDASYGYYTVEYYGYDKFDRKVFHKKFSDVLHKCNTIGTFYTNTDWNSPFIRCY